MMKRHLSTKRLKSLGKATGLMLAGLLLSLGIGKLFYWALPLETTHSIDSSTEFITGLAFLVALSFGAYAGIKLLGWLFPSKQEGE